MLRSLTFRALALPGLVLAAACSQSPQSPVSPSVAAGSSSANPDGSTLKVTTPSLVSPVNGDRTETVRPTFRWNNSTGKFTTVTPNYRLQVFDAGGAVIGERMVAQGGGGQTVYEADTDLAFDSDFTWRVRPEIGSDTGSWAPLGAFKTAARPVAGGAFTGGVGAQRSIFFDEALDIIIRIHNDLRIDSSARARVANSASTSCLPRWPPSTTDTRASTRPVRTRAGA